MTHETQHDLGPACINKIQDGRQSRGSCTGRSFSSLAALLSTIFRHLQWLMFKGGSSMKLGSPWSAYAICGCKWCFHFVWLPIYLGSRPSYNWKNGLWIHNDAQQYGIKNPKQIAFYRLPWPVPWVSSTSRCKRPRPQRGIGSADCPRSTWRHRKTAQLSAARPVLAGSGDAVMIGYQTWSSKFWKGGIWDFFL